MELTERIAARRRIASDEISLKKTIVISLLLHLPLLLSSQKYFQNYDQALAEKIKKPAAEEQQTTFVFVETPENARQTKVPQVTPYISDKNLAASNPTAPENLPIDQPYQKGETDLALMPSDPAPEGRPRPQSAVAQPRPQSQTERKQGEERKDPEQTPTEPGTERNKPQQFDAMQELEALSRLAPSKKEQSQPFQDYYDGPEGRPSAPVSPRYDNRQSRVPVGSDFALSTYDWNWAPYLKELKRKIESNIYPPPAFYMDLARGRTFLRFKIMKDGTIREFEVIGFSGHESLKNTSVKAIESSLPFLPLPSDFPDEFLELRVGFYYNEFNR
jgi:outer membrane biosynthesis protein TonB